MIDDVTPTQQKRCYNERVLEVEKGSFTPLVFSTSGEMVVIRCRPTARLCLDKVMKRQWGSRRDISGMGGEAEILVKKLSSKMEYHTDQRYLDAVGYIYSKATLF